MTTTATPHDIVNAIKAWRDGNATDAQLDLAMHAIRITETTITALGTSWLAAGLERTVHDMAAMKAAAAQTEQWHRRLA